MPLAEPFVVRLLERLRDQDPRVMPAVAWLDEQPRDQGQICDDMVRAEHQRQVGTNVTVRNIITSMRLVSTLDWAKIFESTVSWTLRCATTSEFAEMDFPTRNRYRHAIEELARGSGRSELDVVQRAIAAATRSGLILHPARDHRASANKSPAIISSQMGGESLRKSIGFRAPDQQLAHSRRHEKRESWVMSPGSP